MTRSYPKTRLRLGETPGPTSQMRAEAMDGTANPPNRLSSPKSGEPGFRIGSSHPAQESLRVYPADALTPLPVGDLFGNDQTVEIDLGCGKGRFLLARAKDHPEINYLGIDRMLRRIRKVDRKAVRADHRNIRLFRMDAYYAVTYLIPSHRISTYYILFPDPWPKRKHHDHRLFSPRFIDSLHRTLLPGGIVHIATDHLPYFDAIQSIMADASGRFEEMQAWEPLDHERTDFELRFLGRKTIGRASYRTRP